MLLVHVLIAPSLGPALELSTLGCSSTQQYTAGFTENNWVPHLLRPVLHFLNSRRAQYLWHKLEQHIEGGHYEVEV